MCTFYDVVNKMIPILVDSTHLSLFIAVNAVLIKKKYKQKKNKKKKKKKSDCWKESLTEPRKNILLDYK